METIISSDPNLLDIDFIHHYLSEESYWAKGRSLETVKATIKNSLCFGIYINGKQIGFGRAITDKTTFAYLADIFIDKKFRGKKYGVKLVNFIVNCEELKTVKKYLLATTDAHALYEKFGFKALEEPQKLMELKRL